jgi:arsenite methyltransferase
MGGRPLTSSAASSTGHAMSSISWIDAHYLACQTEYEMMLRSVGLQPGWRVLDAGCGTGQFAAVIADLVGERGMIEAVDVAPESVAAVHSKLGSHQFPCRVNAQVADIKALPFPARTFDAVWTANVAQYLDERELTVTLGEFHRVLKPGGVLAIKDGDLTALQIFPVPPTMLWRLLEAWMKRGDRQIRGLLGSLALAGPVRTSNFAYVRRTVTFIERSTPLRTAEAQFVAGLVEFFATLASELRLAPEDIEYWCSVSDPQSSKYILGQPDLYLREAAVLVIGQRPPV